MKADLLLCNAKQLVTCAANTGPKRGRFMRDLQIIAGGAVAVTDGVIQAVGDTAEICKNFSADTEIDASNKVVCPGFIDPHTHVVYAGDRIEEFEMRIAGATYLEIMAAGGGISATTQTTRTASLAQIMAETSKRLDSMFISGTTMVEAKSGYGLNTESELKMLRAIEVLHQKHAIDLVPTFMGAHAVPAEFAGHSDDYVDIIILDMLPAVAAWYQASVFQSEQIPLFVDVFCEQNAFTVRQSQRVLTAGREHGLQVKAHVDEFTSLGGVAMALSLDAVSVDHLDVSTAEDIKRLAASDTVGVIIPAVNFNLGSRHFADARSMIDAGAAIALTTDINPGSSPCPSLPLVMAIACRYQQLMPAEALTAITINAAYAIGMADRIGSLEAGKQADMLIIDAPDYRHLAYQFGGNLVESVIKRGVLSHV